jgi:hypothetical protein
MMTTYLINDLNSLITHDIASHLSTREA